MAQVIKSVRVFLDSNVVLSGLMSDRGAPRIILDLLCAGLPAIQGLTGAYNLMEIERNLQRKLNAALPVYHQYLPRLNLEVVPLPTKEELIPYQGMTADKDVPVLVSAVNGSADYLVTGDLKDFGHLKNSKLPFQIVTPAEFIELFSGILLALKS